MNKTPNETTETNLHTPQKPKHRHSYTLSNSRAETLERMRAFPERAAKVLETLNADRKKNSR